MELPQCPRCHCNLSGKIVDRITYATCPTCQGIWYEGGGLTKLLRLEKSPERLQFATDLFVEQPGTLSCPCCHTGMTNKRFHQQNLTIDQCHTCQGIWFDTGELPKTRQFIRDYFDKHGITPDQLSPMQAMRAYPIAKGNAPMPTVLSQLPALKLDHLAIATDTDEQRDEAKEEQELAAGVADAEVTLPIWLFTCLTGLPLEVYNPPRRRFPWVVVSLLVINTLIFFVTRQLDEMVTYQNYGASPARFFEGHWLVLITYAFLHAGWLHLLGNMYFLWLFGDNVEDRLGHFNFAIFYLIITICAIACQFVLSIKMGDTTTPIVGASGAVAGVMGAYLYLFPKAALYQRIWVLPYPFKVPVFLYLGFWVALQFVGHLIGETGVAWWAHLGGFFVGLVVVWFWRRVAIKA